MYAKMSPDKSLGDTRYNCKSTAIAGSKSAKVREHPIISCFSRRGKQQSLALGFSPIPAPSKSDSGFLQKQRAARELDSGRLPSGRMRNPNRKNSGLRKASRSITHRKRPKGLRHRGPAKSLRVRRFRKIPTSKANTARALQEDLRRASSATCKEGTVTEAKPNCGLKRRKAHQAQAAQVLQKVSRNSSQSILGAM
ncbi:hypothetical protein F2Q69_00021675 [Brassica cretica]|uniref:Uncharacterized protein n=1 Tax=Brassica cretica TaxID=69181 RepID=A0A8S9QHS2_BRACR|nr:hypothetical protein F2Q69_00021675 [Brassica cretica]